MADKDPKQFRPSGENPRGRNFDADDDPLVELARIVSEDGGFYSAKPERSAPRQQASAEERDDFSADLEAELMQELEFSLRSRQEQRAPSAAPREVSAPAAPTVYSPPEPQAPVSEPAAEDVSFDQATASEPYQDPAELLRALQRQLGGFGHRIVSPAEPEADAEETLRDAEDPYSETQDWDSQSAADAGEPLRDAGDPYSEAQDWGSQSAAPAELDVPPAELTDRYFEPFQPAAGPEVPFQADTSYAADESPFLADHQTATAPDVTEFGFLDQWNEPEPAQEDTAAGGAWVEAEDPDLGWNDPAEDQQAHSAPLVSAPVTDAASWAAASAATGMVQDAQWRGRDVARPVAANDDPSYKIGAAMPSGAGEGRASTSVPAWDEPKPAAGADWLTSGYDMRRELRPAIRDFGDSPEPELVAPIRQNAETIRDDRPSMRDDPADFGAQDTFEDPADEPSESAMDEFDSRESVPVTPVATSTSRSKAAAAPVRGGRRSGRALAAASVVGVLLVGGAVAAYLRSSETDLTVPPQVIRAEEGPVKVEARNEQTDPEADVSSVVPDTPGMADVDAGEEQLVDNAEEPREVARVVLPPPQSAAEEPLARPLESEAPPAAPAPSESVPAQNGALSPIGPRRVRTVVVRPDGTIVASSEAPRTVPGEPAVAAAPPAGTEPAPPPPAAEQPAAPGSAVADDPDGDPLRANTVRTTAITAPVDNESGSSSLIAGDPGAELPDTGEATPDQPDATNGAGSPDAEPAGLPRERPEPDTEVALRTTQPPEAEPAPPVEPAQGTPGELLAGSPEDPAAAPPAQPAPAQMAARTDAPPAVADGFVVQLSSQKTEEQARSSFAALKRQFPGVLGNREANIQQADLGAKGIFYRVRVGPMASRAEAVALCESLQAAGGTCFVGR